MNGLFFGANVDGGTFPAVIWGDYMKRVKGDYCEDFPPPETPFVSTPFFGKYSRSGGSLTGGRPGVAPARRRRRHGHDRPDDTDTDEDTTSRRDPDTGTAAAEADGQQGFDPDQYEAAPQPEPDTAPAPLRARTAGPRPRRPGWHTDRRRAGITTRCVRRRRSKHAGRQCQAAPLAHRSSSEEVLYGNWCRQVVQ